ncbi:class E sortase [Nocardioides daejeonensis]|uniref:class E sortase n=1 Tax=Nocardioides daejeonensis TaxID=1046556 RepID=UPI000D7496CE|nr:class E sortase [Nocardioides daejeonensis]
MGGRRQRPRRPWSWWLGLGLVVAGLGVLGWFGWQFWGTNWVAKRAHARIIEQVEKDWAEHPDGRDPVRVPEGDVEAIIRIPRFGGEYAVPVLRGTSDAVLARGYGHFTESVGAGERGNYALTAHRVTHGEPLRDLPSLRAGDEVLVETREATYTYRLVTGGDDLEVTFRDTWVVDTLPTNPDPDGPQPRQKKGQRLLTLATCAELFHTDNRLVVFGELTDKQLR